MGSAYPELEKPSRKISEVTAAEAERFDETLDRGLELDCDLSDDAHSAQDNVIPAKLRSSYTTPMAFPWI